MSPRARLLVFLIPLLVFLALAALLLSRNGSDPTYLPSARLGQPVPAFALPSLQEPAKTLDNSLFRGQVTLLNVWATWCVSCLVEHPVLMQLAEAGVPIVGINYKDAREAALVYLENNGNPFRAVVSDSEGSLGVDLGVYGAPETYLVDRDGRIRYRSVGVIDARAWTEELKPRYDALVAGKPLPGEAP